jgi:hypothetical protein
MDLSTTYTRHSELQAVTEPPLMPTILNSPQHTLSPFQPAVSSAVPWQRLLTVEILLLHLSDPSFTASRAELNYQLSLLLRPTVSRPVCLGIKHPFGAYGQIFSTSVTVTVLFLWSVLSDERSGLSFYVLLALASAVFFGSKSLGT